MAVAFDDAKAATFAAEMQEPWLMEIAAAIAVEAACTV